MGKGACQEVTGSSFCTDDSSQPLQSCISTSESHTDALSDGLSAVKGWRPSLQTSADSCTSISEVTARLVATAEELATAVAGFGSTDTGTSGLHSIENQESGRYVHCDT